MTALAMFHIDLSAGAALIPALRAQLAPAERSQLAALSLDMALQWAGSRALLRKVLSRRLGGPAQRFRFMRGSAGKPFLDGASGVGFSCAHASAAAACVLADSDTVGIDVEAWPRRLLAHPHWGRFLSPAELAYAGGDPRRFLKLWVLKEAVFKAQGSGPGPGPGALHVDVDAHGRWQLAAGPDCVAAQRWQLDCGQFGALAWAVACRRAHGQPRRTLTRTLVTPGSPWRFETQPAEPSATLFPCWPQEIIYSSTF